MLRKKPSTGKRRIRVRSPRTWFFWFLARLAQKITIYWLVPGNYLEDCQEIITLVCDDNQTKIIGNLPTITKNHGIENYQPTPGETLAEKQEAARNYVSEYSSQRSLGVLRDLLTFAEVPCQHDTLNIAEQDYPIIAFRPDGQQITAANKLSLKNIKNKIQPWLQENLIVIKSPGGGPGRLHTGTIQKF